MHDVRRGLQRNAREVQAELLAGQHVHLVVHQPQRHLRDLGRELLDLDAVELVHIDQQALVDVEQLLAVLVGGAQHFQFKQAQFAVGDDEKTQFQRRLTCTQVTS